MNLRDLLKPILNFGEPKKQFSLGNQSWQRPKKEPEEPGEKLEKKLSKNKSRLEEIFELPDNKDIVIREFTISSLRKDALLIYIDGLTDRDTQNYAILQPLMLLVPQEIEHTLDPAALVYEKLLPEQQVSKTEKLQDVIAAVLDGSTVLLIDGSNQALISETKGWEHRGVEKPATEHVVRGPQESFNESFRANTASIRRYLKDPKLITEIFYVGKRSRTLVGMMYLKDVTNPKLVEEIRYRIQSISETTDYIAETGMLEEYLEDRPLSLVPQTIATERPDRVAAQIREGYIGLVMANSPFSLVLPATYTMFLHASEDYYLRWPFGNFVRFIRLISIFIALLLPAVYISVVNYHPEMIPSDLLLAMTAARESVPFPAIVEILLMEFAFELIREAGIRIPSVIGPTIGLVGALVLGQAAVAASIVSPILIIIIAVTALGSFVVPNYSASFTIRLLRFVFMILGAILGFFGVAFGVFLMVLQMANLNSFGVPFLSPITNSHKTNDKFLRPFLYKQEYRPSFLRPLDLFRQKANSRPWDKPEQNQSGGEKNDK